MSSEAVAFDLEFNSDHSENEDSANVTVIYSSNALSSDYLLKCYAIG